MMPAPKPRGQKLSTWATAEYAHQVETSARAAGRSVSAYVRLALDAMSSGDRHRLSSLTACAVHAELGRLHVRLDAQQAGADNVTAAAIQDNLSRVEALMLSLTALIHREIDQ